MGAISATAFSSRRGIVFVETLLGTLLIVAMLLALFASLVAKNRMAVMLARDTRARLILEGEMEWLRGLPASQLPRPCENEAFEPFLGVPEVLESARFYRTVTYGSAPLIYVELGVEFPGSRRPRPPVTVKGAIYPGENEP